MKNVTRGNEIIHGNKEETTGNNKNKIIANLLVTGEEFSSAFAAPETLDVKNRTYRACPRDQFVRWYRLTAAIARPTTHPAIIQDKLKY